MSDDPTVRLELAGELVASRDRRTLSGELVPFNREGVTNLGPTRVEAGAVSLPDELSRVKLLRDHDYTQPIGYLQAAHATSFGLVGTFKVPEGEAGDRALVEAADKLRDGLSVGLGELEVDVDDGVTVVKAGRLREVSQVAVPAFSSATVTSVIATQPQESPVSETPAPTPAPEEELEAAAPAPAQELEAAPDLEAAAGADVPFTPRRTSRPPLTLARVAELQAAANANEEAAKIELRAALAENDTTDSVGVVPPAYVKELVGIIGNGMPLANVLRQRQLPGAGMTVNYPVVDTSPTVDVQGTENTEVDSTAMAISSAQTTVATIAGANRASLQLVERSDRAFLEAYYSHLADRYAEQVDSRVITAVAAASTEVTRPGTVTGPAVLTALAAQVFGASNLPLTDVVCSPDHLALFADVTTQNGPAFWAGNIDVASGEGSMSGVRIAIDANLPADTIYGLNRAAGSNWQNAGGARLREVQVDVLAVDVGLYGYHAVSIERAAAIAHIAQA